MVGSRSLAPHGTGREGAPIEDIPRARSWLSGAMSVDGGSKPARRLGVVLIGLLLLAVVLAVIPSVLAQGEQGGDDCFREYEQAYEERFKTRSSDAVSVSSEGWSWRPYGVRCTIGRTDGSSVQIVAHPYCGGSLLPSWLCRGVTLRPGPTR